MTSTSRWLLFISPLICLLSIHSISAQEALFPYAQMETDKPAPLPFVEPPEPKPTDAPISQDTSEKPFFGWENDEFILRSADRNFMLRFTGQLQSDYRAYLGKDDETDISTFLVRRARLGIEADMYKYYEFRMLPDFDPNGSGSPKLQDGYMNVHYWDEFQVEMGRFKEPVSYEQLVQDRFVPTLERSMIDQLVPARDVGLMVLGVITGCGKLDYAIGIFNGTINGDDDSNDRKDVAARVAVKPFYTPEDRWPMLQYFGLGISGSVGEEQNSVAPTTLTTPAGVPWFAFNKTVVANGERTRYTPEFTWFYGPFGFASQYYREFERLQTGGTTPVAMNTYIDVPIQGFYLLSTLLITGESRTDYSEAIKPLRPFDPTKANCGPGAIELLAAGSRLELGRDVFNPALPLSTPSLYSRGASEATIGFNWYFNQWVRIQFNYEHSWFDEPVRLGPGPTGLLKHDDAVLTRFQIIF